MLLMEKQKNYYLPLILMFTDTCSDPLGLMVSGYSEERGHTASCQHPRSFVG